MKRICIAGLLLLGAATLCSCSARSKSNPAEETARTRLINEFISLCEKRSTNSVGDNVSSRYYRNGDTPEIILEVKTPKEKNIILTQEQQEKIKTGFINQVGTEFSVGQIREYGKYGIVFTFRGISDDGKELYRIPVRFDTMLEHWGHPNL